METSARIIDTAPDYPVICVDGFFDAPGLNLSHWPGNRTPPQLKHDLSCGIALAFARMAADEREGLAGGAREVVNSHYDTDGCCAAFAVLYPDVATLLSERLLAIAACGDFYRVQDEDAFCCDMVITHMADAERSPIAHDLVGLDDFARWTRAQNEVLRILPDLCAGALELYRFLWEEELRQLVSDLALLDASRRQDDAELDLTVWHTQPAPTCPHGPGRHALFTKSERDRVLILERAPGGTRARLVFSTRSWFDLPGHRPLPRPDLPALAQALNRSEGLAPDAPTRWHAQAPTNASPELWFGHADLDPFAEHNPTLASSPLAPSTIQAAIQAALGG